MDIDQTVNHLFRQESGKMVSVLVKIFGTENFELAEDVVQDALLSALESWKFNGIPDNPRAWLYRTAKNKAIDVIRKQKHSTNFDFSDPEKQLLTSEYTLTNTMELFWQDDAIKDDFLGMMYACCHPDISPENQVTFILKTLCGFSTREIAKAFLTSEDTISKRVYRAKEFFRKENIKPEIPAYNELESRTSAVLDTIYLMFNEGYSSTESGTMIREELIAQAMYLCHSLTENNQTQLPQVYALMALMCFHSARSESRMTPEGELVLLSDQDRSKWNRELVKRGNAYLNDAAFGSIISSYHLEAAIAYEHCIAPSFEQTNWDAILNYYDALVMRSPSPIVFMNRAIAIMEHKGPDIALQELLAKDSELNSYHLYFALLGEICIRMDDKDGALENLERAESMARSVHEKRYLSLKIQKLMDS